ncbi:hypothetical protein [Streptomyces sp. NPDC093223]|uniref:hypothetical protein n=1 Tax=Streptomyces sp. NPDC093223 TaxID=3366033 RepID=UPI0038112822
MHEPHFRPWGTVTPEYWTTGDVRSEVAAADSSAATVVPQQTRPIDGRGAVPPGGPPSGEPKQRVQSAATVSPSPADAKPVQTSATAEAELPEIFQSRITAVVTAFSNPADRDSLAAAGIEAEKLDQDLTEQYGEQHACTINIREIRGWLAHLNGLAGVAAQWYLHTTGLHIALHGADHALTDASVRRAVGTWQQVTDPNEVIQIGKDLARVVSVVFGTDSEVALFVQDRVTRHQQQ